MKHYILCTLIIGYLCVVVFGTTEETFNNATNLEESQWNSTSTPIAQNENDTIVEQGTKSKVKAIFNKVKNKVKQIGNNIKNKVKQIGKDSNTGKDSGRYPSGYRYNKNTNYSNYDSTTLIWIALGTIGGSLLIIFVYTMWKHSKEKGIGKKESPAQSTNPVVYRL